MNTNVHFIDFSQWCPICKHKDVYINDEPCFECLGVPARDDGSRKPIKYEDKEDKK